MKKFILADVERPAVQGKNDDMEWMFDHQHAQTASSKT